MHRPCILDHVKEFYETFFKKPAQKTTAKITDFLNTIEVPKLSEDQAKFCDKYLTGKCLYISKKHAEW